MTPEAPEYSAGLEGIIAGETAVSTVAGGLRYRGYGIEELAQHSTYAEVAFLILNGELPTETELAAFQDRLVTERGIPSSVVDAYRGIPPGAAPMDVVRTGVSMLAHSDPDTGDNTHMANLRKAERLIAKSPTLVAAWARIAKGLHPVDPTPELDHTSNFLHMLAGTPPDPEHARALDVSLILYAEHELNASAFAARVTASTLADLHSAVVAGIAALKGPLHGGANERVVEILEDICTADRAEAWVRSAFAQRRLIMGFGHRVYKTRDPRADVLKELCGRLARNDKHMEWERIAHIVETIVKDEKGLPANMDWPAGRLYHILGLDVSIYTPLFVMSRIAGWAAHITEQHANNRLMRPRALYTGPGPRPYLPITARG